MSMDTIKQFKVQKEKTDVFRPFSLPSENQLKPKNEKERVYYEENVVLSIDDAFKLCCLHLVSKTKLKTKIIQAFCFACLRRQQHFLFVLLGRTSHK